MSSLGVHSKTAALAFILLVTWGASMLSGREGQANLDSGIVIGVEHEAPASMTLTRSKGGSVHITDIGNENTQALFVSLPEDWVRDEVRGVPLAEVTSEEPSFGYRRWRIPGGGRVTFNAAADWPHMTLHNPSGTLLKLRMTVIDLESDTTETNVYLVKDQSLSLHF